MEGDRFCTGCGLAADRCDGACGRAGAGAVARFCPTCGRRLREVAVTPGLVERRCRDHGEVASVS